MTREQEAAITRLIGSLKAAQKCGALESGAEEAGQLLGLLEADAEDRILSCRPCETATREEAIEGRAQELARAVIDKIVSEAKIGLDLKSNMYREAVHELYDDRSSEWYHAVATGNGGLPYHRCVVRVDKGTPPEDVHAWLEGHFGPFSGGYRGFKLWKLNYQG